MKRNEKSCRAMSLVEVALAIGILCFCVISLMGLMPAMLNATRESRATAVVARIYQAVSLDLRENFEVAGGPWFFNQEGLELPGAQSGDYKVTMVPPVSACLVDSTNANIRMVRLTIENVPRGSTNLVRPIFISYGTN